MAAARADWGAAVAELRRGLIDVPESRSLQQSLGGMLHNVAIGHLGARRCGDAQALVSELGGLGRGATVDEIARRCLAQPPTPPAAR